MVEFNQEEAARGRAKTEPLTPDEQARLSRRITLELAEQAIRALDEQLAKL